jgi:RNA polymerase sigma factor (TIGR02999 family)
LQPTALVHEAWMRLATWRTDHELPEAEYHVLASHVMRRVLTDHARRRATTKRDARRDDGSVDVEAVEQRGVTTVLEVDDALRDLAEVDTELAEVVELRFFGGHTLQEIADLRGISLSTANRRWKLARAWLLDTLAEDGARGTP